MSIKYGKNKKQFVNGKRVKNMEIYVDEDIVSVSYDPVDSFSTLKKLKGCCRVVKNEGEGIL